MGNFSGIVAMLLCLGHGDLELHHKGILGMRVMKTVPLQTLQWHRTMKFDELLSKWSILHPLSFPSEDDWCSYFVNDYLPNKRPEDMNLFIDLGFNPYKYLLYLAKQNKKE